jgi:hypothetical protein
MNIRTFDLKLILLRPMTLVAPKTAKKETTQSNVIKNGPVGKVNKTRKYAFGTHVCDVYIPHTSRNIRVFLQ